ncbi:MAG: helix-turn-helix transcriptional regulator [Clostridiales bacterium]|nr:helix-turn-helix transcriptional regulator [Clostridiales bacterium]
MDQIKIGEFLRELRKEKNQSQEQIAERFGVSSRSVSRWENGNTMPDISIMIELADYYEVDLRELLSGERKSEKMNNELKETLVMVADYTEGEKNNILNKVFMCGVISTVAFVSLLIMYAFNLYTKSEWMNDLFVILIYIGGAFSISTVLSGLQLQGKMSKERLKKITKIALPVCIALMVLLSVFIYFIVCR